MLLKTNMDIKTTGAKTFIEYLEFVGVSKIFGYPGATILPLYDELFENDKITHYLCRHEQAAVHAAEGYARVSGKCGVVLVTSGPGATNTVTGIMNAYHDRTPLLVITGQSEHIGHNNFQEVDMVEVTKTCTKKGFSINSAKNIRETLKSAFDIATSAPMGPVIVSVSKSVLNEVIDEEPLEIKYNPKLKVETSQSNIKYLIKALQKSVAPTILVGGGCSKAIPEVRELLHLTNLPVVHTLMGKGVLEDISLGMVGVNGEDVSNEVLNLSDLVLVLGSKLDNRITGNVQQYLQNSKIININIEKNKSLNISFDKEIIGDVKIILQQLISNVKNDDVMFNLKYNWLDKIEKIKERYSDKNIVAISDKHLTPELILENIYNYTKKYNPIVTTDVGQHQMFASKIFKSKTPYSFITSGGFGTMGFGLPAAIGAYLAKPDSLILNITGDGSFQMNMQELGTCLEYKIPVKIFVMNNSSLGMIKVAQSRDYNNRFYQSDMINPDFEKIAAAYDIKSVSINTYSELNEAMSTFIPANEPVLFDIHINSEI